MTIEEFKETVLRQLEKAENCEEVEQIINHSIEQIQDDSLYTYLIIIFLHILQNDLENLSEADFDSVRWRNIHCAVIYLKKISNNRKKIEQ